MPLAAVSASGAAYADFVLEAGDGNVCVVVAPNSMDPTMGAGAGEEGLAVCVWMADGLVCVDRAVVRRATPGGGTPMAPGETVRVRYVAATRMVSVGWRGMDFELAALPTTWDAAHYRFGVILDNGTTMRLTGTSTACACCGRQRLRD